MKYTHHLFLPLGIACTLLGGCALFQRSEPAPPVVNEPTPAPRDWLAEIRAKAEADNSVVEVFPLHDQALENLANELEQAHENGDNDQVKSLSDLGATEFSDSPQLWQLRAEIALSKRHYKTAEAHARRSYDLGPRIGRLCLRSWLLIEATRVERNDEQGAESAAAQAETCRLPPPVRM